METLLAFKYPALFLLICTSIYSRKHRQSTLPVYLNIALLLIFMGIILIDDFRTSTYTPFVVPSIALLICTLIYRHKHKELTSFTYTYIVLFLLFIALTFHVFAAFFDFAIFFDEFFTIVTLADLDILAKLASPSIFLFICTFIYILRCKQVRFSIYINIAELSVIIGIIIYLIIIIFENMLSFSPLLLFVTVVYFIISFIGTSYILKKYFRCTAWSARLLFGLFTVSLHYILFYIAIIIESLF